MFKYFKSFFSNDGNNDSIITFKPKDFHLWRIVARFFIWEGGPSKCIRAFPMLWRICIWSRKYSLNKSCIAEGEIPIVQSRELWWTVFCDYFNFVSKLKTLFNWISRIINFSLYFIKFCWTIILVFIEWMFEPFRRSLI